MFDLGRMFDFDSDPDLDPDLELHTKSGPDPNKYISDLTHC